MKSTRHSEGSWRRLSPRSPMISTDVSAAFRRRARALNFRSRKETSELLLSPDLPCSLVPKNVSYTDYGMGQGVQMWIWTHSIHKSSSKNLDSLHGRYNLPASGIFTQLDARVVTRNCVYLSSTRVWRMKSQYFCHMAPEGQLLSTKRTEGRCPRTTSRD
jgi:hypothetical protein